MKLGILIPTLPERAAFLRDVINSIERQKNNLNLSDKDVSYLYDDRSWMSTGEKRNGLLKAAYAIGFEYVWQVDDDDEIINDGVKLVHDACLTGADVIGINGTMTSDGVHQADWEIRLGHPYCNQPRNGKDYYLRFPNHITPMRLEHAVKIPFPNITIQEDYQWACAMRDAGLLKTQTVIETPVYHYKHRSKK